MREGLDSKKKIVSPSEEVQGWKGGTQIQKNKGETFDDANKREILLGS